MLKETFLESLKHYSDDQKQITALWREVEKNYSRSGRHYHTLTHLDNLTKELTPFKDNFTHWDTIVFAIAYHDIVYNTLKKNNEEKSADVAVKRLASISFPEEQRKQCIKLILATKMHEERDNEINLFTDADLAILGSDPITYKAYSKQIRLEYSIYPDLLYNPGRKKVLTHFLNMDRIYKSLDFSKRYEANAKINLQAELDALTA